MFYFYIETYISNGDVKIDAGKSNCNFFSINVDDSNRETGLFIYLSLLNRNVKKLRQI